MNFCECCRQTQTLLRGDATRIKGREIANEGDEAQGNILRQQKSSRCWEMSLWRLSLNGAKCLINCFSCQSGKSRNMTSQILTDAIGSLYKIKKNVKDSKQNPMQITLKSISWTFTMTMMIINESLCVQQEKLKWFSQIDSNLFMAIKSSV